MLQVYLITQCKSLPDLQVRWRKPHPEQVLHPWDFPRSPSCRPARGSSTHQYAGTWRETSTSLGGHRNFSAGRRNYQEFALLLSLWMGCFYWRRGGTDLLIQVHLPREELFERVQLLAEVFFHHSKQRDLNVLQLGLQRGKLSSLLMAEESDNLSKNY